MLQDFILLEPATPKGKTTIAKRTIGGKYTMLCECRWPAHADMVLRALRDHVAATEDSNR